MPKVSVIIPVYGVEKYIERCARSLFEQTLDDIEYIFVDDCSPDKSVFILERIIKEYSSRFLDEGKKVRIERMPKNCGLPAVRKYGIQLCSGKYIIHCDSDDWVDENMYEKMYNKAIEDDADVVVCDFCRTDTKHFRKFECGSHSTDIKDFLINCLFQKDHGTLCNKLFNRKVYDNNTVYPTGALGEDMVLSIQLLSKCKNLSYIPKAFYYYYLNPMSITKKVTIDNCITNYNTLNINTDFIVNYIENSLSLEHKIKREAISYLRMVNSFSLLKIRHLPEYKKIWKKQFKLMPLSFFLNPRISLYNKVMYLLTLFPFYPLKKDRATI